MEKPILSVNGITKVFVGTVALDHVGFDLYRGEILALLGENGAGKSTMMKILSGNYPCGSFTGTITLEGKECAFHSPREAEDVGIAMIPQEINLELDLSVTENIMLGRMPLAGPGFIDWNRAHKYAGEMLGRLNVTEIDVKLPVRNFSSSVQQLISIARALYREPRILILDEPTSCLTEAEAKVLFKAIRTLQERGISCLYISHKLNEVFKLSDRAVILRDGKYISVYKKEQFESSRIIQDIVGRKLDIRQENRKKKKALKEVLRAEHFEVAHPYSYGKKIIEDVSFALNQGEILGLCGLVGSGRSELLGALFGALPKLHGDVYLEGEKVSIKEPADARRLGIGMLTEDRKKDGFVGCLSIRENIAITILKQLTRGVFIRQTKERKLADHYMKQLGIKAPGKETKVQTLSGGNQQKVIVAKWLAAGMKVLILDEPTRGIDVGTKQEMYRLIRRLADEGMSIIVVSSEAEELVRLCDRFLILSGGKIRSELTAEETSEEEILKVCSSL